MSQQPLVDHVLFFAITLRHITFGRAPLDECSAHRREIYLTTRTKLTRDRHPYPRRDSNSHSQQASSRRPTSQTAGPPRSARIWNTTCNSLKYYKLNEIVVKKRLCRLCFIVHNNSCQVVGTNSDITKTLHCEGRQAMITVWKSRRWCT